MSSLDNQTGGPLVHEIYKYSNTTTYARLSFMVKG